MAKKLGYSEKPAIYWFRDSERNIIYIGSTNNLSRRLQDHRKCIKSPEHHHSSSQKKLYDYLRNNSYKVHYYYCENYIFLEKQLIMKYKPKFNKIYTHFSCQFIFIIFIFRPSQRP